MPIVIDSSGATVRTTEVPAGFSVNPGSKRHVMFRAVFRELANRRAGTASTKRRDEVRGGGRKPWRQKGTGRARQGSTRSPQWTHGGVVFGPKPRSYETSLNRKERRLALQAALSDRFAGDCVTVLATDGFGLEKTAEFARLLFGSMKAAKSGPRTLVVFAESEQIGIGARLSRIGRNLRAVAVTHTGALDVKDVLGYPRMLVTTEALSALAATFGTKS